MTRLRKDHSKSKQAYQEKIVSISHMQCNCRSILTIILKKLQGDHRAITWGTGLKI